MNLRKNKQLYKAYIFNRLYINGVYANMENYIDLIKCIENGKQYQTTIMNNKIYVTMN